jgi:hypothetical protein
MPDCQPAPFLVAPFAWATSANLMGQHNDGLITPANKKAVLVLRISSFSPLGLSLTFRQLQVPLPVVLSSAAALGNSQERHARLSTVSFLRHTKRSGQRP